MVSITVAVKPDIAFDIFTRDIDLWWKRGPAYRMRPNKNGRVRLEPKEGGQLYETFDDGTAPTIFAHVRVWEPGKRIVLDWHTNNYKPGEKTEVEICFSPTNDGTRVIVEHRGWEALPPDHPVRHRLPEPQFLKMTGDWWRAILDSYASRSETPRNL
jgi:uncharacterized protein YndB with AHSA1/START domain